MAADMCDAKIADFGFNTVKLKVDSKLMDAYLRLFCSSDFMKDDDLGHSQFGLGIPDIVDMQSEGNNHDIHEERHAICQNYSTLINDQEAIDYITQTLSPDAKQIVKLCTEQIGLFCADTRDDDAVFSIKCRWRTSGEPFKANYAAKVSNGNFVTAGQTSPLVKGHMQSEFTLTVQRTDRWKPLIFVLEATRNGTKEIVGSQNLTIRADADT